MVLQEHSEIQLLNTIEERTELLQKTGLDHLIIHPFDKAFSRLTAEEFVKDVLVDQLNIYKIVIGHDHRFGRNRTQNKLFSSVRTNGQHSSTIHHHATRIHASYEGNESIWWWRNVRNG